jgi:hypothetical protein
MPLPAAYVGNEAQQLELVPEALHEMLPLLLTDDWLLLTTAAAAAAVAAADWEACLQLQRLQETQHSRGSRSGSRSIT